MSPRLAPWTVPVVLVLACSGCQQYGGLVKPVAQLSTLSPELEHLSDSAIETYLKANARPAFPAVLAVAKLTAIYSESEYQYQHVTEKPGLELLHGDEAEGWRKLAGAKVPAGGELVTQVQFVNRLLVGERPTLKGLRDAAALLHAPLLLVYMQVDHSREGYNDAAMGYWTIVGLFVIPGHTVGHYTVCQGVLIDTRSGFILATVGGEGRREEKVLPGAVDIARDRTAEQAQAEAVNTLQADAQQALEALAAGPHE